MVVFSTTSLVSEDSVLYDVVSGLLRGVNAVNVV